MIIRDETMTSKKDNALLELGKLYGSAKNIKLKSKKELSALIKKEYDAD